MPKLIQKTKSKQGKEYECNKCGTTIQPGEKYFEWTFYRQPTRRQCTKCGRPRQSQLTNSKLSEVYAAQEAMEDAVVLARKNNSIDGLKEAVESAISDCESVRDEYQESLESMGENLAQGQTGQDIQEKIDAIEDFVNTLESVKDSCEAAESEDNSEDDAESEFDPEATITEVENACGEFSL